MRATSKSKSGMRRKYVVARIGAGAGVTGAINASKNANTVTAYRTPNAARTGTT